MPFDHNENIIWVYTFDATITVSLEFLVESHEKLLISKRMK